MLPFTYSKVHGQDENYMITCAYPAVDIGLFTLLDRESPTGHESHFIWHNIPCGYQYICRLNANNYFPRSPRSVLTHAFCSLQDNHTGNEISSYRDTGRHLPLPLLPISSVTFTEASPVPLSESSLPSSTTSVCGIPTSHCVTRVMTCPPTPVCRR